MTFMRYGFGFDVARAPISIATASSFEQNGVTFTADGPRPAGQYFNGEHWVLGPVTINTVAPASATRSGTATGGAAYTNETFDGLMVDPGRGNNGWSTTAQGYTSVNAATAAGAATLLQAYSAGSNKDPGISGALTISAPASLVKLKMLATPPANFRDGLSTDMAILTVVDAIPPANAFRPQPSDSDKASYFTTDDVDLSFLPNVAAPGGMPSYATLLASIQKSYQTSLTHSLAVRQLAPANHQQTYGRDIALVLARVLVALCTDAYTAEQKRTLANHMVQHGLDILGRVMSGGNYGVLAGWGGGMHWVKATAIFAAHALRNAANSAKATALIDRVKWQDFTWCVEDQMFFTVDRVRIETPVVVRSGIARLNYEDYMEGAPRWHPGPLTQQADSSAWNQDYRTNVYGGTLAGVLALRMMGIQQYLKPELLDYIDFAFDWAQIEAALIGAEDPGAWVRTLAASQFPTLSPNYSNAAVPTIVRTVARDRYVWFEFDRPLSRRFIPAASAFAVTVNGSAATITAEADQFIGVPIDPNSSRHRSPNIYGKSLAVRLATAVNPGDTVTIAYTQPGTNNARTLAGTLVPTIAATSATNLTGALPAAVTTIQRVNGQTNLARNLRQISGTRALPATAINWLQMSGRFNIKSRTANDVIVGASSQSATLFNLMWIDATTLRCPFGVNAADRFNIGSAPTVLPSLGTWITWHLWVNYNASTIADMFRTTFRWNGGSFTVTPSGAARTPNSPTLAQLFNQGVNIGGAFSTANRESDADHESYLARWGTGSAPTAPDFTTSPFAWDANWGGNGENVWGQPQLFWAGSLTEWNTSLPNRGSFGGYPMVPLRTAAEAESESTATWVLAS